MSKEYLDISETTSLETAAKTLRDRVLVRILSRLGCRVSEALGLTVDDIDFTFGTVTIVHLKSHVKINCGNCGSRLGLRHEFCPKCGVKNALNAIQRSEKRRQRSLPLDKDTLDLIKTFLESQGPTAKNGKLYLFGINRHRAWQIVRECARATGLGELRNPETGKLRGVSPTVLGTPLQFTV